MTVAPLALQGVVGVASAGLGVTATTATDITTDPASALLQYGAIGVFAFLLTIAVRVLFKQSTDTLNRERARADKLAADLDELRDKIQERYLTTLEQASNAIREALAVTRAGR